MKPIFSLVSLFLLSATFSAAQDSIGFSRLISRQTKMGRAIRNVIVDSTRPEETALRFSPTVGYSPETGFQIGATALLLYKAQDDTNNRQSGLTAFLFGTFKAQYGLSMEHNFYSDKDKWAFLGRGYYQYLPLLYYGIGPDPGITKPATVDATYISLREKVLKGIAKNVFLGLQGDYQQLLNPHFNQPKDGPAIALPSGIEGTRNVGIGAVLMYDSRRNALNARRGLYAELSGLDYRPTWGSDRQFYSLMVDARAYRPLSSNRVLAGQVLLQSASGDLPFNQLALLGGESIMRGYYHGRYRDRELIAAQVEHRWLPFAFSRRFGGVAFLGAATVAPSFSAYDFQKTRLAGGAGVRYLLFPNKDVYLRFDLGVTSDGTIGFYFFTGEAF